MKAANISTPGRVQQVVRYTFMARFGQMPVTLQPVRREGAMQRLRDATVC